MVRIRGQMSVSGLEKLDVWCKARDFAVRIHKEILPLLPPEEKWVLNQQIRRSSQSIPANTAEGHGRFYFQENVRFCYIARGSLEEALSQLVHAQIVGYTPKPLYDSLISDGEDVNRLINGYIGFLKKSKQGANEPGANHMVHDMPADYMVEDSSSMSSDLNIE